jgi:hypothetical protein
MRCKKFQKWTSDGIDGVLSSRKEKTLQTHLASCSSCRDYSARLNKLQAEAANPEQPRLSPEYWREFGRRLERKLSSVDKEKTHSAPVLLRWRWGFGAAGLVVLCALAVGIAFFRPQKLGDVYPLSQGDTLARIDQEVSADPGLANLFDQAILDSIDEAVQGARGNGPLEFGEDPLFLESLTDEEIKICEAEILKKMKS